MITTSLTLLLLLCYIDIKVYCQNNESTDQMGLLGFKNALTSYNPIRIDTTGTIYKHKCNYKYILINKYYMFI